MDDFGFWKHDGGHAMVRGGTLKSYFGKGQRGGWSNFGKGRRGEAHHGKEGESSW